MMSIEIETYNIRNLQFHKHLSNLKTIENIHKHHI